MYVYMYMLSIPALHTLVSWRCMTMYVFMYVYVVYTSFTCIGLVEMYDYVCIYILSIPALHALVQWRCMTMYVCMYVYVVYPSFTCIRQVSGDV